VELAVKLTADQGVTISWTLAIVFFAVAIYFVWRSFYGMRIGAQKAAESKAAA